LTQVYTVSLGLGQFTGPTDALLYTANQGGTIVLRDVLLNGATATEISCTVYMRSGTQQIQLARVLLKDSVPFHLELRQVVPLGAELHFNISGTDTAWVALTGYHLQ